MHRSVSNSSSWRQTVALLAGATGFSLGTQNADGLTRPLTKAQDEAVCYPRGCHTARVVERPSLHTALVDWSDPTCCRYAQQLWRLGVAKVDGHCAISNAVIRAGDAVYRPGNSPVPQNAGAMILAYVVGPHPVD